MAIPQKALCIRLDARLSEQFLVLHQHVPGLNRAALVRALLADQLSKPLESQLEIVTRQIVKPPNQKATTSRIPPLNSSAKGNRS